MGAGDRHLNLRLQVAVGFTRNYSQWFSMGGSAGGNWEDSGRYERGTFHHLLVSYLTMQIYSQI